MKYNFGCGFNKFDGFVNIDKFEDCEPDLLMDIEALPWPIESDTAEEAWFVHCLEHVGADPDVFIGIIKELYRICRDDAKVRIHVPHPRSDNYLGDPTHVRPVTPMVLSLFSKKNNIEWQKTNASNSPLAIYHDVDFEVTNTTVGLAERYKKAWDEKKISREELHKSILEKNNVVDEFRFELKVIK